MADANTDDTTPEQQGGGALGVTGGAVLGIGAGTGVSHLMDKGEDFTKSVTEAQAKARIAKADYDKKLGTDRVELFRTDKDAAGVFTKHDTLEKEWKAAANDHLEALNTHWNAAAENATPANMQKMRVAHLAAQEKILETVPAGETAEQALIRKFSLDGVKKQKGAVEKITLTTGTGTAAAAKTQAEVKAEIQTALDTNWNAAAETPEIKAYMQTVHKDPSVITAMEKAAGSDHKVGDLHIVEHIKKETKGTADKLSTAKAESEKATAAWAEKSKGLAATERTTAEAAENAASRLGKIEELNKGKNFGNVLKRPWTMMRQGGTKERLLIGATAVAIGVATYMGIRASRNSDRAESHVEQVEQSRAAAATAGQSASPA